MALDNLISVELPEDLLNQIDQALEQLETAIRPHAINLTNGERRQYGSIADTNKVFVDKTEHYINQYPELVPRFMDVDEFNADYKARTQIEGRVKRLENIVTQLADTKTLLDHDNYNNSLSFYRNVKYLARENELGAQAVYDDMKQHFKKSKKSVEASDSTDVSSDK